MPPTFHTCDGHRIDMILVGMTRCRALAPLGRSWRTTATERPTRPPPSDSSEIKVRPLAGRLTRVRLCGRLMLCYPDEFEHGSIGMAAECLRHYSGECINAVHAANMDCHITRWP